MKLKKLGFLAASCGLLTAMALPAQAVLINDNYIGADAHGSGDVIGSASDFQIFSMDVTRNVNILTVVINTNFAGKGDDCLFGGSTCNGNNQSDLTNSKGIGYGDLFLAAAWTPSGSSPYSSDDNSNGTKWLYGFSLDNRWQASSAGAGSLYKLNGATNNANALLSQDFLTGGTFRNGQEVAVDTASSDTAKVGGGNTSSWSIDEGNDQVIFTIDLTGTSLVNSSEFALHWAMTCANDTIEGGDDRLPPVPVPAAVWLFGSGLLGLVSIARRRKRS